MDNSAPLQNLFVTNQCYLCASYLEVNIGVGIRCWNRDSRPHSLSNQLLEVVAGVDGAAVLEEEELSLELAADVELSAGFDASPPDFAPLLFAEAGFAEE